jgi:AcrR family transcriptional regulator
MEFTRSYVSPVRDEAARATGGRILDAAERLFVELGYGPTTIASIAGAAGVSKQTVYNSCGSKSELLKRLYDVRLVGDEEPVPFAEREDVRDVGSRSDPRALLDGYGQLAGAILERLGPVMSVVVAGAAAGDPDLRHHLEVADSERLTGAQSWAGKLSSLGALRPGLTVDRARDIIWAINSVQTWDLLVRRRGWSTQDYAAWLGEALAEVLLAPG